MPVSLQNIGWTYIEGSLTLVSYSQILFLFMVAEGKSPTSKYSLAMRLYGEVVHEAYITVLHIWLLTMFGNLIGYFSI